MSKRLGAGQMMPLAVTPTGSFHSMLVPVPESPGFFQ
jgi:hypothetical protein